jgi:FXSXX-COOH protein
MRPADEAPAVSSSLLDFRHLPLTEVPTLASAGLDGALQRVLPGSPVAPVPVAAFGSAI